MLVMALISGLVEEDSQRREQTMVRYINCIANCCVSGSCWGLMASTGRPDRYGVVGVMMAECCRCTVSRSCSTKAG